MKSETAGFPLKTINAPGFISLALVFAVSFMLLAAGCQPLNGRKTGRTPPSGAELFKSKCSRCHDPELALQEYRPEDVWRDTITRMREDHKADISPGEIDRLVQYHFERQQREAAIFQEKCSQCHPGRVFLERELTPDQARAIIRRMQEKAGNTIEDNDVEIIVRYHIQAQKAAMEKNLLGITRQLLGDEPDMQRELTLFVEKCSACHNPSRALAVTKDPELWAQTIRRMQSYSKGDITDQEAEELVDFHVSRQQMELNTFQETCTKCHDDDRINSRSLTDEQWLATIRRMQQKAPELITDEKVNILAAYFHRRELTLARIFTGKCALCHLEGTGAPSPFGASPQMDGLVALARDEIGESLQVKDVKKLSVIHVQRQERMMQLYKKCSTCHTDGIPSTTLPREQTGNKRSRAEWISFIAALQGVELTKEVQTTINSQIDYHVYKY